VLRAGLVTVNTALGLVSVAGRLVTLSPIEYALLVALASRPGARFPAAAHDSSLGPGFRLARR
jgi:DNA-binding response OmpR family regulator